MPLPCFLPSKVPTLRQPSRRNLHHADLRPNRVFSARFNDNLRVCFLANLFRTGNNPRTLDVSLSSDQTGGCRADASFLS